MDLVALLLARVDVLGYGESRGKDILEAQQLAVGLPSGLQEGYPLPGDWVLYEFSCLSHGGALSCFEAPSHTTNCAAFGNPMHLSSVLFLRLLGRCWSLRTSENSSSPTLNE